MLYRKCRKGETTLKERLYQTGQFAEKASVTVRTLRFYDKAGLLSPSHRSESGYRLYAEDDLSTLERILALKFLGLSLEMIRLCLRVGPGKLEEALAQQKAMMREKRAQLDSIVKAIEETEALLQAGTCDWESVARVVRVIQMEQKTDWMKKHFTDEQLKTMSEMLTNSYSAEASAKLAERGGPWTEEDQNRASAQWSHVYSEAKRLADSGADPGGEEAQAVVKLKKDLISQVTQNDPEIEAGLKKFWESFSALPKEQRPFAWDVDPKAAEFLERAGEIYAERKA